jgi:hypothetical protein
MLVSPVLQDLRDAVRAVLGHPVTTIALDPGAAGRRASIH